MAKKCAICGGKVKFLGSKTCFVGGLDYVFNSAYVPLINGVDRSEGWFCQSCANAVGQARGTLTVNHIGFELSTKPMQVPGQIREGIDYLKAHLTDIRNPIIKENVLDYIAIGEYLLETKIND